MPELLNHRPQNDPQITLFIGGMQRGRRLLHCLECGRGLVEIKREVVTVLDGEAEQIGSDNTAIVKCKRCGSYYHLNFLL